MIHRPPDRTLAKRQREFIQQILDKRDWTGARLAREAGLAASTVNRFMNAADVTWSLSADTMTRLARAGGVALPWFADQTSKISVKFIVREAGVLEPKANGDQATAIVEDIEAPPDVGEGFVAAQVIGNAMWPALYDGDILVFREDFAAVGSECIGKDCVCDTGDDCRKILHILNYDVGDRYTVMTHKSPPQSGVAIKAATPIVWIKKA